MQMHSTPDFTFMLVRTPFSFYLKPYVNTHWWVINLNCGNIRYIIICTYNSAKVAKKMHKHTYIDTQIDINNHTYFAAFLKHVFVLCYLGIDNSMTCNACVPIICSHCTHVHTARHIYKLGAQHFIGSSFELAWIKERSCIICLMRMVF